MSCCFQPPFVAVTKDHEKQKPAIIRFYNYIKGETDIVDQKIRNYYVKPKSSKWTITAFSYIFDVARINAITLSRHNQKKSAKTPSTDAFMSGWKLAMSLIQSQLHHRCIFSSGLQKYMQKAIAKFFGVMIERLSITPGKRKCCWICLEKIESVDKKNKKGSIGKTISRCVKWDKHFAQTIFKGFVRHFSSKHYYSLLFASKKEAIEEEVDNEYECYL